MTPTLEPFYLCCPPTLQVSITDGVKCNALMPFVFKMNPTQRSMDLKTTLSQNTSKSLSFSRWS